MYERSYGSKYAEGKNLPLSGIARLIRRDIKAAVNAGELPGSTKNYSVRTQTYAGGGSINVLATGLDGMWTDCTGIVPGSESGLSARTCPNHWCAANNDSPHAERHQVLSVEGQRVKRVLNAIHGAYNHDGSEVMVDYFDVNYYGSADIEDAWRARSRAAEKARKAARTTR